MSYSSILENAKKNAVARYKDITLDGGLILQKGSGHTWAVADAKEVHVVLTTAVYYCDAKAADSLNEEEGLEILKAIAACQRIGTGTREDGNFLWYAEETRIQDYNAAFFAMSGFIKLCLCLPEKLSEKEKSIIGRMMKNSLTWFTDYCKTVEMYYPNPAISNIMCLYCISALLSDKEHLEFAKAAMLDYFDYCENRGWGWGESISPSYIMEITVPLKMIILTAKKTGDSAAAERASKLLSELLEFIAYQGDLDFVPSIRNYNVSGNASNACGGKLVAGVTDDFSKARLNLLNTMIFRDELERYEENHGKCKELWKKDTYVKKIFDETYSTTWRGENIHLGTISEYPFMPAVFQNPTWGTGWQTMPVAFAVRGEQLAYLRWEVTVGERRRCFPHETRLNPNDVNASLFNEHIYPDMYTLCKQDKNVAVIARRMTGLHNVASEIVDEFAIARYEKEPELCTVNGIDWAVLKWKDKATVLIGALHGITLHTDGNAAPQPPCLSIVGGDRDEELEGIKRDGNRCIQRLAVGRHSSKAAENGRDATVTEYLTLSQVYYKGENIRLDCRALESSWAVIALDRELENAEEYIKNEVKVTLSSEPDYKIRRWNDSRVNVITVEADGKTVTLRHDPYDRRYSL